MLEFEKVIGEINKRIILFQDHALSNLDDTTSNIIAYSLISLKNTLLEKNHQILIERNDKYTSLEHDKIEILKESKTIYLSILAINKDKPNKITAIKALRSATKETKAYPNLAVAKKFIENNLLVFGLKY